MKFKTTELDRTQVLIEIEELVEIEVNERVYYCAPVPDYEDYFATTCGFVISKKQKLPRVLRPFRKDRKTSYLKVDLGPKTKALHRVIAATFQAASTSPCRDGQPRDQVNHIDGNPANNKVANLEIVSAAENTKWRFVLKAAKAERQLAKDSEGYTTL
jgi:hypothetical protein